MTRLFAWILILSASANAAPGGERSGRSAILPLNSLHRIGLTRAWQSSLEVDPSRGEIFYLGLHVSQQNFHPVFQVVEGNRVLATYSARQYGTREGTTASEIAKQNAENLVETLTALKRSVSIVEHRMPHMTLYAQSNRGAIHALDAETGATRWIAFVGNSNSPKFPPAFDDRYVAAVSGAEMSLLEASTGKEIWTRPVAGIPTAGPAIGKSELFVPVLRRGVQVYSLEHDKRTPRVYGSAGRVLVQPNTTAETVSWPTDGGTLYVARSDQDGLLFRLETLRPIVSQSMYQTPHRVYTVTEDGFVYALHEISGNIRWTYSCGARVVTAPVPFTDAVHITTADAALIRLSADSGQRLWSQRGIQHFVSSSQKRIYAIDVRDSLSVLDADSGACLGAVHAPGVGLWVTNSLTDRIFLGSSTGTVQCLREQMLDVPLLHRPEPSPDAAPAEPDRPVTAPADQDPQSPGGDVFGQPTTEDVPQEDESLDELFGPVGEETQTDESSDESGDNLFNFGDS